MGRDKSHESYGEECILTEENDSEGSSIDKKFEKSKLEPEVTINQNNNIEAKEGCTIYEQERGFKNKKPPQLDETLN